MSEPFGELLEGLSEDVVSQRKNLEEKLLEKRLVVLDGSIDDRVMERLKAHILELYLRSRKKSIHFLINTTGGICAPGFEFYDFVQLLNVKLIGIVCGECSSMGLVVLQACTKRYATYHSEFLIHNGETQYSYIGVGEDVVEQFRDDLERSRRRDRDYLEILSKRSGQTIESLEALCKKGDKDYMISSSMAKNLCLIDDIFTGKLF